MQFKTKAEEILGRSLGEEEDIEDLFDEVILDYVSKAPPKIWHQMLMKWNFDRSDVFLDWLIENPLTDKATILMLYWRLEPLYFQRFKDREDLLAKQSFSIENFERIQKIESKYVSKFYKNSLFSFNPKQDDGEDWTKTANHSEFEILKEVPKIMFEELEGIVVDNPKDYTEGIPPELDVLFHELFDKYDY